MKRLLLLLPALFVAALSAAAPSISQPGTAALSTFLTDATARGDVPGVVVAVVNKDGVLYHEAFGKSSTLRNSAMAKDTMFNIASMTKAVTSVAIMMLVDEGKLKLDDDVAKYLPKYKDPLVVSKFNAADGSYETRPAKRPMTIRHLLTHTSGIGYGFASQTVATLTQKTGKTETGCAAAVRTRRELGLRRQHAGARARRRGDFRSEDRRVPRVADSEAARHAGHELSRAAVEVSARRRGEPARRRRQVHRASGTGHDPAPRSRATAASTPRPATTACSSACSSTAADSARRASSTRRPSTTMFENHTGTVVVPLQQSTNLSLSRNFPVGAGEDHWGLGFQLAKTKRPNMRTPGSGTWAGIFNTHFFIDPSA